MKIHLSSSCIDTCKQTDMARQTGTYLQFFTVKAINTDMMMDYTEPSASGSAPALPSGKEDQFAPLLTVSLRLSSDHWVFSRKSERQGRAPSFPFEF